jgi:glycosyltransferase involved in cell wall biosynthesis
MNQIRTNVIEFGHLGHQRQHLLNVVKGWRKYSNDRWSMRVTATPEFARAHPDVEAAVAACGSERVEFHVLRPEAAARLSEAPLGDRIPLSWIVPPGPPKDSLACSRWEIAQASASEHGANRLFLMNLDEQLISLAAHMESNADVYGLVHAPPARGEGVGYRRRWALHQRAIFTRALSHQRLRCIFSFDESLKDAFSNLPEAGKIVIVPDPVALPQPLDPQERDALRVRLGIGADRIALFFFGQLASRKGILELLLALSSLPPHCSQKVSLIVAGAVADVEPSVIESKLEGLRERGVHIVRRLMFISEGEAVAFFEACDAVVVPYLRHTGISGVLLRAAAHRRPVLSQEHGLMGELVRRHKLGIAIDPEIPPVFAAALQTITQDGFGDSFDPDAAFNLAKAHNSDDYQRIIYERLGACR